jgi:hypothetical protein
VGCKQRKFLFAGLTHFNKKWVACIILLAKYGYVHSLRGLKKNKRTDELGIGVRMGRWCQNGVLVSEWGVGFRMGRWCQTGALVSKTLHLTACFRAETTGHFWRSCDRTSLMYSFKYNQQDATLYNILYYCRCSTCFGRFLRPSAGAQELYTQQLVLASLAAVTASVVGLGNQNCSSTPTTLAVAASSLARTRCCVYSS